MPPTGRIHQLKIWPEHFDAVRCMGKRAELRRDDREPPFADGDTLVLREWDPTTRKYTGPFVITRISHVLRGPVPGLEDGYAILSITKPEPGRDDVHVVDGAEVCL